ncbi:hypothetical protein NMY22_g18458 [Coprinellus aureogranulatus]|nr:hypothetical protein NMY22_g18458 [Coprinellus aureogranulatus]
MPRTSQAVSRLSRVFTAEYAKRINAQITSPAQAVIVKPNELYSALTRPPHLAAYEPDRGPEDLAATMAYGVIKGHPFMDGNKRTAYFLAHEYRKVMGLPQTEESIEETAKRYMAVAAGKAEMEHLIPSRS